MTASDLPAEEASTSAPDEHVAEYVAEKKYPNLFTVFCSCGRSSFGSSLRDSAEASFARHVENPAGDHFRDEVATARLLDILGLTRKATA